MSLFVRVLPIKVPDIWDSIKFAISKVNDIQGERLQRYVTYVLCELLAERMNCFIRVSEDRELLAVVLTRIMENPFNADRTLLLDLIYSFKGVSDGEWIESMEKVKQLAREYKCDEIMAYSYIPRMYEILETVGMKYKVRVYSYDMKEVNNG